jgi:uncharacterized protein YcbX
MSPKTLFFPVAGCVGIERAQAAQYQHRWLIVDARDQWLSAKSCPALQQIAIDVRLGSLELRAPGMLRIDVPLDVIEDDDSVRRTVFVGAQSVDVVDEGDVTATWVTHVAGQPCRLVKVHPEAPTIEWPID